MPGLQDNAHNPLELAPESFILVAPSDSTALMATSSSSAASSTFHTDRAYSRWYPLKTNKKAQAFHAALAKLNTMDTDATDARAAMIKEATTHLANALNPFACDEIDEFLSFDIRLGKYSTNIGDDIYNCLQSKFTMGHEALLVAAVILNLPHVVTLLLNDAGLRQAIKSYPFQTINSDALKVWENLKIAILQLLNLSIALLNYKMTDLLIAFVNKDIDKKIVASQGELDPDYVRNIYFSSQYSSPIYEAMKTNEVMINKIIETNYPYFFTSGHFCRQLWEYLNAINYREQLAFIHNFYEKNLAFFKLSHEGFISVFDGYPSHVGASIKHGTTILNPYNQVVFNLIISRLLDCLDHVYGIGWHQQKLKFNHYYSLGPDPIDNMIAQIDNMIPETAKTYDDYTQALICNDLSYLNTDNKARLLPAAIAIIPRLEAERQALEKQYKLFIYYVENILIYVDKTLPIPYALTQQPDIDPNYREATTFELVHPVVIDLHEYIQHNRTRLITAAASILDQLCEKRRQLIVECPGLVSFHRIVLKNPLTEIHPHHQPDDTLEKMYPMIRQAHDDILSLTHAGISAQQQAEINRLREENQQSETNRLREENRQLTERLALLTRPSTCPSALFPSSSSALDDDGIPTYLHANATSYNNIKISDSDTEASDSDDNSDNEIDRRSRKHERPHHHDSYSDEEETPPPSKYMRGSHSGSP